MHTRIEILGNPPNCVLRFSTKRAFCAAINDAVFKPHLYETDALVRHVLRDMISEHKHCPSNLDAEGGDARPRAAQGLLHALAGPPSAAAPRPRAE